MDCPHFWGSPHDISERLMSKKRRKCGECQETENLWVCIKCQHIGCGISKDKQHAFQHYAVGSKKSHSIACEIHSGSLWCFKCDSLIYTKSDGELEASKSPNGVGEKLPTNKDDDFVSNGVVGLYNLGNTCYMNSAIQCLSQCPSIALFFQSFPNSALKQFAYKPNPTANYFSALIKEIWSDTLSDCISPSPFVKEIKAKNALFSGYSQQDSAEFLRYVLDVLNEGMQKRDNYKSPWKSIIFDTFRGELQSTVKCLSCKNNSDTCEYFFDLPVELEKRSEDSYYGASSILSMFYNYLTSFVMKPLELKDCFDSFTSKEILSGANQYKCEKCKQLTDCEKSLRIKQSPEILIVQLKRFRYQSYLQSKISSRVNFPMRDFDISDYMVQDVDDVDDVDVDVVDHKKCSTKYDLIGIINHRGSIGGGHYVAYCRNVVDSCWYEFDDSFTRQVSESYVQNNVQAYVLFYRKKTGGRRSEERSIVNLALATTDEHVLISKNWLIKWKTLCNPGIISNSDFICKHGGINSRRVPNVDHLFEKVPLKAFDFLSAKYGNDRKGMILREPNECKKCEQRELDWDRQREEEKTQITRLDAKTAGPKGWFIISDDWLTEWHDFMAGGVLPGPIRNETLLMEKKEGGKVVVRKGLRIGIHYRSINENVWFYLAKRYGGGPEINRPTSDIYSSVLLSRMESRFIRMIGEEVTSEMIFRECLESVQLKAPYDRVFSLPLDHKLSQNQLWKQGKVVGVDVSSVVAVQILDLTKDDHFLDLCCAPGVKLLIAGDMIGVGGNGSLTGIDVMKHRLHICVSLLKRFKQRKVRCFLADATRPDLVKLVMAPQSLNFDFKSVPRKSLSDITDPPLKTFYRSRLFRAQENSLKLDQLYDKVLVDAECSHDGSIKHVLKSIDKNIIAATRNQGENDFVDQTHQPLEHQTTPLSPSFLSNLNEKNYFQDPNSSDVFIARMSGNENHLNSLYDLQRKLLKQGLDLLKVGGTLVYSTCSMSPLQNENIVESVLSEYPTQVQVLEIPDQVLPSEYQITRKGLFVYFHPQTSKTSGLFIAKMKRI